MRVVSVTVGFAIIYRGVRRKDTEAQAKAIDGVRQAVSPGEAVRKRWFSLGKALGLRITETGSIINYKGAFCEIQCV